MWNEETRLVGAWLEAVYEHGVPPVMEEAVAGLAVPGGIAHERKEAHRLAAQLETLTRALLGEGNGDAVDGLASRALDRVDWERLVKEMLVRARGRAQEETS